MLQLLQPQIDHGATLVATTLNNVTFRLGQWLRRWQDNPPSLRFGLALLIGGMTLVPNIVLAFTLLQPIDIYQQSNALKSLLLWVGAVTLFSAGMGYVVARFILEPIDRLRNQVQTLKQSSQPLQLELDAVGPLPVEVNTLRVAFDDLLGTLRLEQSRRDAFMATLVHDLKTPIIAANHVLSVIQNNEHLGREERITLVQALHDENDRLLGLVQQMVDAYRFERGEVHLSVERQDLRVLADGLCQRFAPRATEAGIALSVTGHGFGLVSKNELERALANLLENALRYAKSKVLIGVGPGVLVVRDDGPGLPLPLARLAQPFSSAQVVLAGKHYTAGTGGLGLFIASRIAAIHNGSLEALPPSADWQTSLCLNVPGAA